MDDQFSLTGTLAQRHQPLAERLRPRNLDEIVGQPELTDPDSPLRRAIESGQLHSCCLVGTPGTGKTTIALALAAQTDAVFEQLNAVTDGIKDLRDIIARAQKRAAAGERTLLFIDEIARWNKAQQDALLPYVENGTVTLIGATTENPSFQLNNALLSRLRVYTLRSLNDDALAQVAQRALTDVKRGVGIPIDDSSRDEYSLSADALALLVLHADGDARRLLGAVERAVALQPDGGELDVETIEAALGARALRYDGADEHYATVSAFIKSIRGSDVDAALYWLARMEAGGEDPLFIARRLLIAASEEVGVAASGALAVAVAGMQACQMIGPPECWLHLAHVTCYLARSPKSWAAYQGLNAARAAVADRPHYPVPAPLKNPSTKLARQAGDGQGYVHASKPGAERMQFLPDELRNLKLYRPSGQGQDK